jgi:hypothetical protein
MNPSQLSHDILNCLERLRIMHDLVKAGNYTEIPKAELEADLKETLKELETKFAQLLQ